MKGKIKNILRFEGEQKVSTVSDMDDLQGGTGTGTGGSSASSSSPWYSSLFNNLGGIFSGAGDILSSILGTKTPQNYVNVNQDDSKSNVGVWIAVTGVAVVVIILVVVLMRSKK